MRAAAWLSCEECEAPGLVVLWCVAVFSDTQCCGGTKFNSFFFFVFNAVLFLIFFWLFVFVSMRHWWAWFLLIHWVCLNEIYTNAWHPFLAVQWTNASVSVAYTKSCVRWAFCDRAPQLLMDVFLGIVTLLFLLSWIDLTNSRNCLTWDFMCGIVIWNWDGCLHDTGLTVEVFEDTTVYLL